jgi:arylsulfatase A-like enzyme
VIHADDMGWSDLACYGHPVHQTPHIDQLAADGMLFTQAYAAAPVCLPTRAAAIFGLYPARLNVTGQPSYFDDDQSERALLHPPFRTTASPSTPNLFRDLENAGYETWLLGKWNLTDDAELYDIRHFPGKDEAIVKETIRILQSNPEKPLFLHVNFAWPHIPLKPYAETKAKYEGLLKGTPYNPDYAAITEQIDIATGQILDALDQSAMANNTLVIFLSDNGGFLGFSKEDRVAFNEPLRDGKASLYEGGIRVPMIVRWPGHIKPGSRTDQVTIAHLDLYPTQLELAGISLEGRELDGISLVDTLLKNKTVPSPNRFWHWPHYRRAFGGLHASPSSAIRSGDWKLIHFYETGHHELYNLADDPGETNDLSQTHSRVAGKLAIELETWKREVGAQLPIPNPEFHK